MSFSDATEPGFDPTATRPGPVVPAQFTGPEKIMTTEARESPEAEAARLRAENAELRSSVVRLANDGLVPGFKTEEGVTELIKYDEELRAKLITGRTAVIHIDARGIKALNETDLDCGDEMLLLTAKRVIETLLRNGDLISRKGDDFSIILHDVSIAEMGAIVERLKDALSVDRALEDTREGALPVIASVSGVHADEFEHGDLTDTDELLAFVKVMRAVASGRNVEPKKAQYAQMWELAGGDPNQLPGDDRRIADKFYETFCPDFIDNIAKLVAAKRRKVARVALTASRK
jgi:GGDEF domain-containing protein